MAEIYIRSIELISILKISSDELIRIENFFDSIPDDEWELSEGKDYKIVCQKTRLREYTTSGAYTIAKYLETTQKKSIFSVLKEWIFHTKEKIRQAFIKKKVLDNCSSLLKRNDQFFISRSDVVAIFGTRADYLRKMDEKARNFSLDPLTLGIDYEDFLDQGGLHYSISGIYKLARALSESLTQKNRREWCQEVGKVVKPQVEDIVKQIIQREKNIQKVMERVKKRDRETCQITEQKKNPINKLKIAAHHLYSRNEYPHLADVENNLITLSCEVHEQFHQEFMGGTNKPCTIDDLINFVHRYYPENSQVILWLEQQKIVLGNPQPITKRQRHVLYLPASRVQESGKI
jgi:hypothetical protein